MKCIICGEQLEKISKMYDSKDCYNKMVKKYIWEYQFNKTKRQVIAFIKLIYKTYLKDYVEAFPAFMFSMFILCSLLMILNTIIWAVETFIK